MTSFMGKILRVDLSARTAESVPAPPEVYEAVLAGKGLAVFCLFYKSGISLPAPCIPGTAWSYRQTAPHR